MMDNKIGVRYKFPNIVVPHVVVETFFTGVDEFDSKMPLHNQPLIVVEGSESSTTTAAMLSSIKRHHRSRHLHFYYLDMLGYSRPYRQFCNMNGDRDCVYLSIMKSKDCCDFISSLLVSRNEDSNAVIFVVMACVIPSDHKSCAELRTAVLDKRKTFPNLCLILATDARSTRPGARMYADAVYKETGGDAPGVFEHRIALIKARKQDVCLAGIKQPFSLESP